MTRLPGWQSALEMFLEEHRADKFKYGTWDCCLFVCDAILAMTGIDVAEPFRGQYGTRAEALRAVKEFAGKASVRAVAEKVTADHEMPKVPTLRAQRGDVVLIRRGKRDFSLGIVALNGLEVIALSAKGMLRVPLSMAVSCWRV